MTNETLKSLSGLIIGAMILFLIVLPSCSNFFRENKEEAFHQAIALFEAMLKEQKLTKSFGQINLKEDTFLFGINAHVNEFVISQSRRNAFIKRPLACPEDTGCICFCVESEESLEDIEEGEIRCKDNKFLCKEYPQLVFPEEISGKDFFGPASPLAEDILSFQQGFFLFYKYRGIRIPQPVTLWYYRYEGKIIPTINPTYLPFPTQQPVTENG